MRRRMRLRTTAPPKAFLTLMPKRLRCPGAVPCVPVLAPLARDSRDKRLASNSRGERKKRVN